MGRTYNLSSQTQVGKMQRKINRFRKTSFLTDLHLVCQDGTVSVHKIVFIKNMQEITDYLCDSCDHHSDTVMFLPDVVKSDLEKEVKNLYSHGIASGLKKLFGFKKKEITDQLNKDNEVISISDNQSVDDMVEIDKGSDMLNLVKNPTDILNHSETEIDNKPFVKKLYKESFQDTPDIIDMESDIIDLETIQEDQLNQSETKIVIDLPKAIKEEALDGMIKDVEELQIHSFELIKTKAGNRSPGILLINDRFKYVYKSEWRGKYTYQCVQARANKCRANALLQRDDATGQMRIARCSTDDEHNHEALNIKTVDKIVRKMNKEMMERIATNPDLSTRECLTTVMKKYKELNEEDKLWEDVESHWNSPKNFDTLRRALKRARQNTRDSTGAKGNRQGNLSLPQKVNPFWMT